MIDPDTRRDVVDATGKIVRKGVDVEITSHKETSGPRVLGTTLDDVSYTPDPSDPTGGTGWPWPWPGGGFPGGGFPGGGSPGGGLPGGGHTRDNDDDNDHDADHTSDDDEGEDGDATHDREDDDDERSAQGIKFPGASGRIVPPFAKPGVRAKVRK
jgi:hypothetical protein